MTPIITAFASSPDKGRGLARDMRVRWALEEAGRAYEVRLVSFEEMKQPAHLALHPFGQIPTWEEEGLSLFETGSVVLRVAEEAQPGRLLPAEPAGRARAIMWMFAALNTVEPPIVEREMARLLERDAPWAEQRALTLDARVETRLRQLSQRLGEAEWLEPDGFTAGDLMMVSVLMRLEDEAILEAFPNLSAYLARARARPAFERAFEAQWRVFLAAPQRPGS